ncbi:RING finger protein 212B [Zophobas morio]|uniref:RING finger protein 212B n=1 Tax=Zophobas morio TaxID=2755281 RepID=UPI00308313F0
MSDWVHCNKCCIKYGGQTSFFLVECGHIFCQRCVETIRTTRKCVLCNKSGNILPLNKDLEQSVLDFFLPMENIFRKGSEIYRFQLQQRTLLYQKLMDKYNYAKKEYMNCSTNNKHLQKENQMLRSMLRAGKNSQRFVTSTPVSQPSLSEGNVTFQNASLLSSIPAATRTPSAKMYPGYSKRSVK